MDLLKSYYRKTLIKQALCQLPNWWSALLDFLYIQKIIFKWKMIRTKSKWAINLFLIVFLTVFQITVNQSQASERQKIKFETKSIQIDGKKITVEIAKTKEQQERGLMFRRFLKKNHGMLFIFDQEIPLSFWMKNTYIDLSIGYFDKDLRLIQIIEMTAENKEKDFSNKTYPSDKPAMYALEMNKNWFKENKVTIGSKLTGL